MDDKINENLGKYDELELVELNDVSVYGGTGPSSMPCVRASIAVCPTTACSRSCP